MKSGLANGDRGDVHAEAHAGSIPTTSHSIAPPEVVGFDVEAAYREHGPFIGRVIQRLIGDRPEVDDLLQETFIVAHRRHASFRGDSSPRTWLYGIAHNLCAREGRALRRFLHFRSRLSREPRAPSTDTPERTLERSEAAQALHAAIQSLPFQQREVLVLYELEQMEGKEIAELVGIPLGTVWTRLHHARAKLRKKLSRRPS